MNVRSPSSQDQVLILQPDNPSNTTIVDSAAGEVVYKVHTEHGLGMTITYFEDHKVELSRAGNGEMRTQIS